MKATKIFTVFTFVLAFAVCGMAQQTKPKKGLDNLDLMNTNRQSTNSGTGIFTPNELEGYEFFKKGKLKELRIGLSTKADVIKIFGSSCEKPCQYDADWTISFSYFSVGQTLIENLGKPNQKNYVPRKEAIGKIEEVRIRPKNQVSFKNITLPSSIKKYAFSETAYSSEEIREGVEFDVYADSFGLQYLVFDKLDGGKVKSWLDSRKQFSNFRQGDLIIIKYMLTEETESQFFVEQK